MSATPERHRFTPTTIFIWSSLLIWMTSFVLVYVFAALACARQFADVRVMGVGIVPFTTALCLAVAALATGWLMHRAWRRLRAQTDAESSFLRFIVLATGVLALIGLTYLALPSMLLAVRCAGGA
jgi:uncharacterized membrane protein